MNNLLSFIPQMLRHAGDSDEVREQAVFAAWLVASGGPLRKVTTPVRLERKTLIVAVPDATWQVQLAGLSGQAIFKLNSLLGAPLVTALEYIVNPGLIVSEPEASEEVKFFAPEEQVIALREQADRIPDLELRRLFLQAAGKCLERRAK